MLHSAGLATHKRRILLRSSWQTVNIGDIAHTPGFLNLMETYLPDVEVTLWPKDVGNGVREILLKRFPKLKIAESEPELRIAFNECDLFVHGSAAGLSSIPEIKRWERETGKPFGVYAITFDDLQSWKIRKDSPSEIANRIRVLNLAKFVYFRDRESLQKAQSYGCDVPVMDFAPDAAFATDLRNDTRAKRFLQSHGLKSKQFLCCIPRYRFSPYWLMKEGVEMDPEKHAINVSLKEQDHAPLRKAVRQILQETELKVLLCPEDRSQIAINKELIYDQLSAAEQKRVVWKSDYWLTGEAISTYRMSAGLFGNEMHSPILCIGNGIPALVCRWEGQTSKGTMWNDIGLDDWLFNFDHKEDRDRFPDAALELAKNPDAAFSKALEAKKRVEHYQRKTMIELGSFL